MTTALHIVQLTDLHVRPRGQICARFVDTNQLTERALRAVAALRPAPDLILVSGDLTECGLPEEYAMLREIVARALPAPLQEKLHVIPGNHDRREALIAALSPEVNDSGFVDYVLQAGPVRVIMLDTVVAGAGHGELRPAQLDWLDRTLARAPDAPTMLAMHHPPLLCGIAAMDRIPLHSAEALKAVLRRHPQVELIVAGHHHRAITARCAQATVMTLPSVGHQTELDLHSTTMDLMVLEPGCYGLHRWTPESGFVSHLAYVESFPGPFPCLTPPEYPGRRAASPA